MDKLKNLTIQKLIEYDKVHFVKPWLTFITNMNQQLNYDIGQLIGNIANIVIIYH